MDYLKVDELKEGYLYRIKARNGTVGVWHSNKSEFLLSRYKFGHNFLFGELHWDIDKRFGTVKPLEELEKSPFAGDDVTPRRFTSKGQNVFGRPKEAEILEYLNLWEKKLGGPHPRETLNE